LLERNDVGDVPFEEVVACEDVLDDVGQAEQNEDCAGDLLGSGPDCRFLVLCFGHLLFISIFIINAHIQYNNQFIFTLNLN
jgi:hypothetical protein